MTETSETTPPTASGPQTGGARLRAAALTCQGIVACATMWEESARIIGDQRAGDIKRNVHLAALALEEAAARVELRGAEDLYGELQRPRQRDADEYMRQVVAHNDAKRALGDALAALGADGGGA